MVSLSDPMIHCNSFSTPAEMKGKAMTISTEEKRPRSVCTGVCGLQEKLLHESNVVGWSAIWLIPVLCLSSTRQVLGFRDGKCVDIFTVSSTGFGAP